MICFSVEIIGLLLVGVATMRGWRKSASYWRGQGFRWCSRIGRSGGKSGSTAKSGGGAGTYTVFMDLSLGVTGPLAGLV